MKKFKDCESGNIAMMFALLIAMAGVCLAAALDGAKMISVKTQATAVADAAALAGASASENNYAEREAIVQAYIEANAYRFDDSVVVGTPTIKFDDENEIVTVEIPTTVALAFGGFVGAKTKPVGVVSTATYLKNNIDPVTIAFALDVSGSMDFLATDGRAKIEVLKSSTKTLFDAIESGTDKPEKLKEVLRSGMSSYNTELVDSQQMSYGWSHLEAAVSLLTAQGGTNSTPALENSYTQLMNDRSFRAYNDPKFDRSRLKEFVIFMTDGDNNQPEFDTSSYQLCLDMRAEGIEIYSVAFEAPEKGELLLVDCASPDAGVEDTPDKVTNKNPDKCMNNGNGNGQALGHCGKEDKELKSDHYFDANDAKQFQAAFKQIGEEIVKSNVRLN